MYRLFFFFSSLYCSIKNAIRSETHRNILRDMYMWCVFHTLNDIINKSCPFNVILSFFFFFFFFFFILTFPSVLTWWVYTCILTSRMYIYYIMIIYIILIKITIILRKIQTILQGDWWLRVSTIGTGMWKEFQMPVIG